MTAIVYARYELLRSLRNRRFFLFSLVIPLILYFVIAGSNRHARVDGISFPVYYMTGMVAWGSMVGMLGSGARIALERQVGWIRQMKITPLSTSTYFGAKILSGYVTAAATIVVISLAGTTLGVHLTAAGWVIMVVLVLVGLIPFAFLGVIVGHLVGPDSIGPALGGGGSLLALIGGAFTPLSTHGALHDISEAFPSYWLVQAGKAGVTHHAWPASGWAIMAAWAALFILLAAMAYQRDTQRVT